MRSGHYNLVTSFLSCVVLLHAAPALAQVIETARDATAFCRYSETRYRESGEDEPTREEPADEEYSDAARAPSSASSAPADDNGYEKTRRQLVHRPLTVELRAEQAPIIGYDRGTGILSVNVYGEVPVVEGFGLRLPRTPTLDFELPEARAQELVSSYQAGTVRLKVVFLPPAYAQYDLPLCEEKLEERAKSRAISPPKANRQIAKTPEKTPVKTPEIDRVIVGELLAAHLIDREGEELASFQTQLGHEVEMMRNHRITGYLASALPSVHVSSLVLYEGAKTGADAGEQSLDEGLRDQLGADLQKVLFGCYVRGLRRNARLQGALVVQFTVGPPENPRVLVDSIHHSDVVNCSLKRVARLAHTYRSRVQRPASFKATLIFKLQEPRSR